MNRSRRTAGTSLVEILVVIVVFLIGILAIVQIFPGGFRLLGFTRSGSQAVGLARTEIERLKARPDRLPDRIVPVNFIRRNGELVAVVDSTRRTNDLGPTATALTQTGDLINGPDNVGPWRRASAANMVNRIIGESALIPAPRPASGAISGQLYYGGLMNLQFGPVLFNPEMAGTGNPQTDDDTVVFSVYANDLALALGTPASGGGNPFREYMYYCSNPELPTAALSIPQAAGPIRYRLAATGYVRNGVTNEVYTVETDQIITVPAGVPDTYFTLPLNMLFVPPVIGPTDTFLSIQYDSLQLAPIFERINKGVNFALGNPYQYKLIDDVNAGVTNANMGALLFNPAGYKYFVPNSLGRRIPLMARVNYNVYDWGIIRQDFRIPSENSESTRLALGSIKVRGNADTDGRAYQGLGFVIPNGTGGNQQLDVVIQDTETGGIYAYNPANLNDPTQTSYLVDRSIGSIRFVDRNTATPELEVTLYEPSTWTPIQIPDARGRSIRVLYQSVQEYQVQVMKASSQYTEQVGTPNSGRYALGAVGDPLQRTKLYFSNNDLGRSVSVGEAFVVWDLDGPGPGGATEIRKVTVAGTIKAPTATDPIQQPYLDLTDVYGPGWATSWSPVDETGKNQGYMVRNVRGASVAVRVLWNPQKFGLTGDSAANMTAYDRWAANWRKTTTETFLQKGGGIQ